MYKGLGYGLCSDLSFPNFHFNISALTDSYIAGSHPDFKMTRLPVLLISSDKTRLIVKRSHCSDFCAPQIADGDFYSLLETEIVGILPQFISLF